MENNSNTTNNNKISYDINDIQNISMINGKLEFELKSKPKVRIEVVEEKKPKKEIDPKVLHQKRQNLVTNWYKNYYELKRKVNEQGISENDLKCQIDWQIERLKEMIKEPIQQQQLEELFEYGVIANMNIIANEFRFPQEIRIKLSAYTGATLIEIKNHGDETFKIIMGETRKFVEDHFYYAFIITNKMSVLKTNEEIRYHYEANLEAERDMNESRRLEDVSIESITKAWEKSMPLYGITPDYF